MIRILLTFGRKAYGFDVTGYEDKKSESGWYDNLLTEDLVERVGEGDTLVYVGSNELAKEWCEDNEYDYEFVEANDNN